MTELDLLKLLGLVLLICMAEATWWSCLTVSVPRLDDGLTALSGGLKEMGQAGEEFSTSPFALPICALFSVVFDLILACSAII